MEWEFPEGTPSACLCDSSPHSIFSGDPCQARESFCLEKSYEASKGISKSRKTFPIVRTNYPAKFQDGH